MDPKLPPTEGVDQPPPYSATATTSPPPSTSYHPGSLTSHLHSHLEALPARIQATQESRSLTQSQTDTYLLDHIIPNVEAFLADAGRLHPVPNVATLTLVPAVAVPENAQLSELDDMKRRGEFGRVCRVDMSSMSTKDTKTDSKGSLSNSVAGPSIGVEQTWTKDREFTDWGRWNDVVLAGSTSESNGNSFWWRDESTARRLASYLQPLPPRRRSSRPKSNPVEQSIPAEKEKKGWFGFRRIDRSSVSSEGASGPTTPRRVAGGDVLGPLDEQPLPSPQNSSDEARAVMNVSAQEVAFRKENDFGIWESTSGWAIVVQVKVTP